LSEACGNAVRHAASGGDSRCVVEVRDEGPGFAASPVIEPPAVDAESGRGLWVISCLVDELEIGTCDPSGTVLRFVVQLAR
jgi:anti-sigma regulatory factor (Ser/Thr protein kinase)